MWKGCTEQRGAKTRPVPVPDRGRGEGEREMLSALWQNSQIINLPVPARCLPLNIEPAPFSAAHTLQQQREALHSVQLQLFEKQKKARGFISGKVSSKQQRLGSVSGHSQGSMRCWCFPYAGGNSGELDQLI